jgi:hypothetical protein
LTLARGGIVIGAGAGTVLTGTLIMAALAYKGTDFVKYVVVLLRPARYMGDDPKLARSGAWNGLVTLLLGCAVGIGVVFLMAHTAWSNQVRLGNRTLKHMPWTSDVVLGAAITAISALIFDVKKAVDRNDSASTPKLMPKVDALRRERLRELRASLPKTKREDVGLHNGQPLGVAQPGAPGAAAQDGS